jgi:hypothetical protein
MLTKSSLGAVSVSGSVCVVGGRTGDVTLAMVHTCARNYKVRHWRMSLHIPRRGLSTPGRTPSHDAGCTWQSGRVGASGALSGLIGAGTGTVGSISAMRLFTHRTW